MVVFLGGIVPHFDLLTNFFFFFYVVSSVNAANLTEAEQKFNE